MLTISFDPYPSMSSRPGSNTLRCFCQERTYCYETYCIFKNIKVLLFHANIVYISICNWNACLYLQFGTIPYGTATIENLEIFGIDEYALSGSTLYQKCPSYWSTMSNVSNSFYNTYDSRLTSYSIIYLLIIGVRQCKYYARIYRFNWKSNTTDS